MFAGTLDVSRSWRRKVVRNSSLYTWRKMRLYSHLNGGTIQRYRSSSIQEYQCLVSWNPEKEKTPYTSMRILHWALVPNYSFCKSVQYLRSSFVDNSAGQEKQKESVSKGVLTSVKSQQVKLLVSSPRLVSGNSLQETFRTSNHCPRQFDSQQFANVHRSGTGISCFWATKLDLTRTTVLGRSFHFAEDTRFLE